MAIAIVMGLAAVIVAGVLQGLFAVPMKYAPRWSYEHIWLIYSLVGMVVLPWILITVTVPHLTEVYSLTPALVLVRIAGFGLCWGIGSALAGLGMNLLGIGLGMAIILGLSASVGSLIPLLILTPQQLHTPQGHTYVAGTVIMLVGIVLCARAGMLRDAAYKRSESAPGRSFVVGFIVCFLSGLFSSSLNFSYAFGGEAVERARAWCKSSVEHGSCDSSSGFRRLYRKPDLLRLSPAQEPDTRKDQRRWRRHRMVVRCTHGFLVVWRSVSIRGRHNPDGRIGGSDRLAFAHGHDHRHQQRSWNIDW